MCPSTEGVNERSCSVSRLRHFCRISPHHLCLQNGATLLPLLLLENRLCILMAREPRHSDHSRCERGETATRLRMQLEGTQMLNTAGVLRCPGSGQGYRGRLEGFPRRPPRRFRAELD
ncbi:hypothetical protein E2C01_015880 [Portunus trituberculatus]|uniref:Uncharacterized protein n=1 Tax=Portunus trituberculatus TaxID=210409 RepID=A0A5B7DPG2_PORTR|nr:hypothetical protein [Portunus trituberculatus]